MPIPTAPTSVDAPATTQITANALFVDALAIGTPDRAGKTSIALTVTPYQHAEGEPDVFAAGSVKYGSADLFALAGVVPECGVAVGAVYAAVAAIAARVRANAAALIDAEVAVTEAQSAVQPAMDAAAAAGQARTAAFATRNAIADADSPEYAAAHVALVTADADYQAAQTAATEAQTGLAALQVRVTIAKAAVADPANPPLTPEAVTE